MTIFEAVKTTVTPRMAAEHFGLNVSRNGMVCCPFHDDRHPSMKLYEDHYHCFGCQAKGLRSTLAMLPFFRLSPSIFCITTPIRLLPSPPLPFSSIMVCPRLVGRKQ